MSFSGDLGHFPVVDIVQLLHSTRKTGTLNLSGSRGESQLVFRDGYIVSANHHNIHVKIGRILVEMGALDEEDLRRVLGEQARALGKPLVAVLIESGVVNKEAAYKGLETLIQLTIVEVLSWNEGAFSFNADTGEICDEYRYFPSNLNQELALDAQGALMDALRIYDERNRDGETWDEEWLDDRSFFSGDGPGLPEARSSVSAADLGLDEIDRLERKIPGVFTGLRDNSSGEESSEQCLKPLEREERPPLALLGDFVDNVRDASTAREVAHGLLRMTTGMFGRCLVLVVKGAELIPERSVGIIGEGTLRFSLPLSQPSLFADTVRSGRLFLGESRDEMLHKVLFNEITAPAAGTVLLMPLLAWERTIALIYADYGDNRGNYPPAEPFNIAMSHARLVLDNAFMRTRVMKKP
ncbi:DUF4388 domain-containing protein [Geobacter sp. DSM 9736]|uniref:DUF4388 domain-containing protein n=1 Tax=Geobacter sp. DSM 9736 TaxID=1277350 RepID=UPI000B501FC0|nr:DUF4388 domain-containing protein [Geobacter sp. DSM 9736]SNB45667.1 protein of unknown function [Geobacter sp. DSM 9736]